MAEDTRWTGGVPSDEVLSAINRSTVLTSNFLQRTLISYELGQASVKSQSLRVDVAQPSPQEQLYITVHRRTFDVMELQYFSNGPQRLQQKSGADTLQPQRLASMERGCLGIPRMDVFCLRGRR